MAAGGGIQLEVVTGTAPSDINGDLRGDVLRHANGIVLGLLG